MHIPLTDKQLAFVTKLLNERRHNITVRPEDMDKRSVSLYIKQLLSYPMKEQPEGGIDLSGVPEGRYAAPNEGGELRFVRIDKPSEGKWAGYTFVQVQASDEWHRAGMVRPGEKYTGKLAAVLSNIVQDAKAASVRYGHELGQCGVCGRLLTDEVSRKFGVGPVCREKLGW